MTTTVEPIARPARPVSNRDVYEKVTASIVAAMEAGTVPWERPFNAPRLTPPANAITGRYYHGANVLALICEAWSHGYASSHWLTFQQARTYGVSVRKGEKGTPVFYMNRVQRRPDPHDPDGEPASIFFARLYYCFNVDQIGEGQAGPDRLAVLRAKCGIAERPALWDPVEECERVVAATGADIREGARAAYHPTTDYITMPARATFPNGASAYYPTLFHELAHWTGNSSRLARNSDRGPFGSPAYAFEELVAELGGAFLSQRAGLDHVSQASAYMAGWLKAVRDQPNAIITAARLAQAAADYIWPVETDDGGPDAPATETVAMCS